MKRIATTLFLLLTLTSSVLAKEGMWLMSQLKDLDLAEQGIQLTTDQIYSQW